jgi:hypothetical protein
MPRKRLIDYDALAHDDELLDALKPDPVRGANIYVCLWGLAEDWGGYEYNPRAIARRTGFFEINSKEVEHYIIILIKAQKIIPFKSEDGKVIHWLRTFKKHQTFTNPIKPKLPLPPWVTYELKKRKKKDGSEGKTYADYQYDTGKLPLSNYVTYIEEFTGKLPVSGNRTELNLTELNKGEGVSNPPSDDKDLSEPTDEGAHTEQFIKLTPEIKKHTLSLMEYWNMEKFAQGVKGFHPIGFLAKAASQNVPPPVVLKVLRSMDRQKEKIENPYAWITSTMKIEWEAFNFEEELKAHQERKAFDFKDIGDVLGEFK